jgi:hypothetical protein
MKQFYVDCAFRRGSLRFIATIDKIVEEYIQMGYRLTVRQLYYQLVARAIIPNTERDYKNTTRIVNDAKLAGLLDWDAIEDRTREFIRRSRWDSAADALRAIEQQFHMDLWANQDSRVFVIVEKEALAGVLERVCHKYDVPLLAARGYPSGTVLREFCESDVIPALEAEKEVVVLHLGDHDPSGIDMSRDLEERICLFSKCTQGEVTFNRIALNMAQIKQYNPPPNPAKQTDIRFAKYAQLHGQSSWELDALDPRVLSSLVEQNIALHIDQKTWQKRKDEIAGKVKAIGKTRGDFEVRGV